MLLRVLDVGSKSAQLQVFEARPGAPPLLTHAVKEPTLPGEASDRDGAVEPAGVDRVVEAVNHAIGAARRLGAQQLYVFTTSMKALNVSAVDVCPWALREGILLRYLQTTLRRSLELPLRPLNGAAYETVLLGSRGGGTVSLLSAPASGT